MCKKILIIIFFFSCNLQAENEYFLTLRFDEVNLRQGPSREYPINDYCLKNKKILNHSLKNKIDNKIEDDVLSNIDKALNKNIPTSSTESEINDVYTTDEFKLISVKKNKVKEIRFVDAIKNSLHDKMKFDDKVIIMGQDIAEYGGVFKVTEGFLDEFGRERVRNTPITESAVIGCAMGLSFNSFKPVVEMQFADFASVGFNQIVNNLAKTYYRWGQPVNVTLRMPTGGGIGAGPFHSQSNESWFSHVPGLKIVYPSTA
jgi:2-oxoisovalerate dehydrogenase E1 component